VHLTHLLGQFTAGHQDQPGRFDSVVHPWSDPVPTDAHGAKPIGISLPGCPALRVVVGLLGVGSAWALQRRGNDENDENDEHDEHDDPGGDDDDDDDETTNIHRDHTWPKSSRP